MSFASTTSGDISPAPPIVQDAILPNQLHGNFTGFTADPNSPTEPLHVQAYQFQAAYPGGEIVLWKWDQDGMSNADAVKECVDFLAIYRAGNKRGAYTKLILRGHSFGGDFLRFLIWWLSVNAPDVVVDLAVFYDPVPNPICGGVWGLPTGTVTQAIEYTQDNGLGWMWPMGPNGKPLAADPRIKATYFPFGTKGMTHLNIVPQTWGEVLTAMIKVVSA